MAMRLQKIIWSLLCGSALGLGVVGCHESGEPTAYGPPPDVETDGDGDVSDAIEDSVSDNVVAYGPAPMYGPEP